MYAVTMAVNVLSRLIDQILIYFIFYYVYGTNNLSGSGVHVETNTPPVYCSVLLS
jgi:hypothetical protein